MLRVIPGLFADRHHARRHEPSPRRGEGRVRWL
jgi:hypothetical protein